MYFILYTPKRVLKDFKKAPFFVENSLFFAPLNALRAHTAWSKKNKTKQNKNKKTKTKTKQNKTKYSVFLVTPAYNIIFECPLLPGNVMNGPRRPVERLNRLKIVEHKKRCGVPYWVLNVENN